MQAMQLKALLDDNHSARGGVPMSPGLSVLTAGPSSAAVGRWSREQGGGIRWKLVGEVIKEEYQPPCEGLVFARMWRLCVGKHNLAYSCQKRCVSCAQTGRVYRHISDAV